MCIILRTTHTVPTPPERLNHTRKQEEHTPRREHSSTNKHIYHIATNTTSMHVRSTTRGLNHTRTQENNGPHKEHSSTNESTDRTRRMR